MDSDLKVLEMLINLAVNDGQKLIFESAGDDGVRVYTTHNEGTGYFLFRGIETKSLIEAFASIQSKVHKAKGWL